jgi:hypothetical protein
MDATAGGFNAADAWPTDISGPGALVEQWPGTLTLSGKNSFRRGTVTIIVITARSVCVALACILRPGITASS